VRFVTLKTLVEYTGGVAQLLGGGDTKGGTQSKEAICHFGRLERASEAPVSGTADLWDAV